MLNHKSFIVIKLHYYNSTFDRPNITLKTYLLDSFRFQQMTTLKMKNNSKKQSPQFPVTIDNKQQLV